MNSPSEPQLQSLNSASSSSAAILDHQIKTEETAALSTTSSQLSSGGPSSSTSRLSTPQPKGKLSNQATEPTELDPFYETLLEDQSWLPGDTKQEDFTPEVCKEIERKFWRGLGVGDPAWYGADMKGSSIPYGRRGEGFCSEDSDTDCYFLCVNDTGSLFTDETKEWNVANLPNLLNRLKLKKQLPGVNTPVSTVFFETNGRKRLC